MIDSAFLIHVCKGFQRQTMPFLLEGQVRGDGFLYDPPFGAIEAQSQSVQLFGKSTR